MAEGGSGVPSVYNIEPRFRALLRPLVRRMAGAGVHANPVTGTAIFASVAIERAIVPTGKTDVIGPQIDASRQNPGPWA